MGAQRHAAAPTRLDKQRRPLCPSFPPLPSGPALHLLHCLPVLLDQHCATRLPEQISAALRDPAGSVPAAAPVLHTLAIDVHGMTHPTQVQTVKVPTVTATGYLAVDGWIKKALKAIFLTLRAPIMV
jgi:hypothetical protein